MAEFNKYSISDFFDFESWEKFAKMSASISKKITVDLDVIGQGIEKTGNISKEAAKNLNAIKAALKAIEQQASKSITVSEQLINSFHKQRKAFEENAKTYQDSINVQKTLNELNTKANDIAKKVEKAQKDVTNQMNEVVKASKKSADANKFAAGSYDELKNRVKEITKEMKALGNTNEDIANKIKLAEELEKTTQEIKDFDKALKDAQSSVKATENDIKHSEGSFDALKARISELKKEMKALGQSSDEVAKKEALNNELKNLTKQMQDFTNEIKQAEKEAKKLSDEEAKLGTEYSNLKSKLADVLSEYNKLNQKKQEGLELSDEEVKTMDRLDAEAKQIAADMKKISDSVNKATSEYDKLSKELNELRKEYKDLAAKKAQNIKLTDDEAKRFKELERRGKELDKILKDIDGTMGQFQRNVGNYSDAIDGFLGNFGGVGQALSGIMQSLGNPAALGVMAAVAAGIAFSKLWEEIEKTNKIAKEAANITQLQGEELFIVAGAAEKLAEKYEVDVNRVIRATNAQMKLFGMSAKEATDAISLGLQFAGSEADDLLDAMNEYSPNFKKIGLDGKDAMIVISKAVRNASFTIDKAGDIINNFGIEVFTDDFLTRVNKVDQATVKMFKDMKAEGKSGGEMLAAVSQRILELQETNINKAEQLKTAVFTAVGEEGISDAFIRDLATINGAFEKSLQLMTDRERKQYELNKAQNEYNAEFAEFSDNFKDVSYQFDKMILSLKSNSLTFIDMISRTFLTNIEKFEIAIKKSANWVKDMEKYNQDFFKSVENMKPEEKLNAFNKEASRTSEELENDRIELQKLQNQLNDMPSIDTGFTGFVGEILGEKDIKNAKEMRQELEMNIAEYNVSIEKKNKHLDLIKMEVDELNKLTGAFKLNSEQLQQIANAQYDARLAKLQAELDKNEGFLSDMYDNEAVYYDDKLALIQKNKDLQLQIEDLSYQKSVQNAKATIVLYGQLNAELDKLDTEHKSKTLKIKAKTAEEEGKLREENYRKAIETAEKLFQESERYALKMKQIFAETEQLKRDAAKTEDEINKIQINRQIEANEEELNKMGLFNMKKTEQMQKGSKMRETIIKVDGENSLKQLKLTQDKEINALQEQNDAIERKAAFEQRGKTANEVAEIQARNKQIEALQSKHLRDTEKVQADTKDAILQNEKQTNLEMEQLYAQRREMVVNSVGGGLLDAYQNMEQKRIDAIEDENKRNKEKIKLMIKMIGLQMILSKLANPKADTSQIAADGVRGVIGQLGSFKEGGYTGSDTTGIYNKDGAITGVTHKNEFVANEETTLKNPKTSGLIKILDTFQKTGKQSVLNKIPLLPTFNNIAEKSNSKISEVRVVHNKASIDETDIKKLSDSIGKEIARNIPTRDISETADLIILKQSVLGKQREIRIVKGRKWFKY